MEAGRDHPAGVGLRSAGRSVDITVASSGSPPPVRSATLGPDASNTGVSPTPATTRPALITGTAAGRGYWQTNSASPAPCTNFFYMNVADSYAYDTKNIVLVSIDYFDAGNGQAEHPVRLARRRSARQVQAVGVMSLRRHRRWKTHDFVLDDSILTNRSNGADFRSPTRVR